MNAIPDNSGRTKLENQSHLHGQEVFHVDETSDLPIWVQLRNRITYLIRTGCFKPGEQLPSVRSLSSSAKINYNTVARSYKDLEQSGLIVSMRGRGMYVQKGIRTDESEESPIDALLENCVQQYRLIGMNFEDIRVHIDKVVALAEKDSRDAVEKREGYL